MKLKFPFKIFLSVLFSRSFLLRYFRVLCSLVCGLNSEAKIVLDGLFHDSYFQHTLLLSGKPFRLTEPEIVSEYCWNVCKCFDVLVFYDEEIENILIYPVCEFIIYLYTLNIVCLAQIDYISCRTQDSL